MLKLNLAVVWLDLANAYGLVPHWLIAFPGVLPCPKEGIEDQHSILNIPASECTFVARSTQLADRTCMLASLWVVHCSQFCLYWPWRSSSYVLQKCQEPGWIQHLARSCQQSTLKVWAHVRVVSLCRHRRKKFPRKYSPSLKCTGLPNEGKFCKSNASFAHDSQNSTLSNGINYSTLSFL